MPFSTRKTIPPHTTRHPYHSYQALFASFEKNTWKGDRKKGWKSESTDAPLGTRSKGTHTTPCIIPNSSRYISVVDRTNMISQFATWRPYVPPPQLRSHAPLTTFLPRLFLHWENAVLELLFPLLLRCCYFNKCFCSAPFYPSCFLFHAHVRQPV